LRGENNWRGGQWGEVAERRGRKYMKASYALSPLLLHSMLEN
jgi:hypothetical protein